ncbi:MAG: tetratricopeptide repeat protein [Luteimonas sp.]
MTRETMLFAAVAAIATLAVLGWVLRPLWRAPATRVPAAGLVAGLALAAFLLYRLVGTPAALDPAARTAPATLEGAIAQLEARLQADPSQVEGWRLLGQAYAGAKDPAKAADAFARAARLAPDDPDVLVEAAESRALAAPEHRIDALGVAWLDRAMQLPPTHQRARWFSGIAKRQAGDAAGAAATWTPLLAEVEPGAAAMLRPQIDAARAAAGLPPLPASTAPGAPAGATTTAPAGAHAIQARVSLDPALAERARLDGDATVFVIARAPNGPPMPIAVERHRVSELPFTATLDDADGPMPTAKLSGVGEVEVVARISRSGDAMPQAGDLESAPVRIGLPADAPVDLVIGQAR